MKKKILLFEPDALLRTTLLEQLSLNKDLEINESGNFKDVQYYHKKSSFDLIIMGTDREAFCLCSIGRFIKEIKIKNRILFMIESEQKELHLLRKVKKSIILLSNLLKSNI